VSLVRIVEYAPSFLKIFWISLSWACCNASVCCKRCIRFSSISAVTKRRKPCAACSDASLNSSRISSLAVLSLSSISPKSDLNDFHRDFEKRLMPERKPRDQQLCKDTVSKIAFTFLLYHRERLGTKDYHDSIEFWECLLKSRWCPEKILVFRKPRPIRAKLSD